MDVPIVDDVITIRKLNFQDMNLLLTELATVSLSTTAPQPDTGETYLDFLERCKTDPRLSMSPTSSAAQFDKLSEFIYELEYMVAYGELQLGTGFLAPEVTLEDVLCVARNEGLCHRDGPMVDYFTSLSEKKHMEPVRLQEEERAAYRTYRPSLEIFIDDPSGNSPHLVADYMKTSMSSEGALNKFGDVPP